MNDNVRSENFILVQVLVSFLTAKEHVDVFLQCPEVQKRIETDMSLNQYHNL
jgi:hypothetical protein